MKLTIVFVFLAFVSVHAEGTAQSVTLSGKNLTLKQVFSAIKKQTGYVFLSNEKVFSDKKTVSLNLVNAPIPTALEEALRGRPFRFNIMDQTIVIYEKKSDVVSGMMPLETAAAGTYNYMPPLRIRVIDSVGNPLAGAAVVLNGARKSGDTNPEGYFTTNAVAGDELTISFIGYQTRKITVTEEHLKTGAVTFFLRQDAGKLDEINIVVNTGYQSLPRERATGSFGIVTSKQLEKVPVTSLLERIQGLVPGVDVSTKTTAGKSRNGTVKIRGLSTIVSSYTKVSTDPLLVIDGFPSQLSISGGALDYINPDDVESISFLKDAAAASIWGMQAANGVIVIQTKRGALNKRTVLNFATTIGTSARPSLDYGTRMSVPSYIELEKELIQKGRLLDPLPSSNPGAYYPENISQAQEIVYRFRRGTITEAQMNQELATLGKNDNMSQMEDYMLQSPTTRQYNLSLSGGGPTSSYFLSGYMYKDDRVYAANNNRGYSLKANNTSSLLDGRVTITSDLTFSNTKDKINGAAVKAMSVVSGGMRPYDMLKDANGNNIYYDLLVIPKVSRLLESQGYQSFLYSPVDELNYSNTVNNGHNFSMNLGVNANITPWLTANVSGNIGRVFFEGDNYWDPESYDARIMVNKATSVNSTGGLVYGIPVGGRLELINNSSRSYNVRGQLNMNKTFHDIHQVSVLVGTEIREVYTKGSSELRYGYDKSINTFRSVNPSATYRDIYGINQTIGATSRPVTEKTTRALSHYANGSYTLMGKYILSGSARFDDYNLLGVDRRDRALPLWSGGLRWDIGKEDFMRNIKWINRLAFRATYGISGNAPQGFAPVTVIGLLGADFYTGYNYANISSPAVQNLGWEKTRMTNFGVDFSLFSNRFSGSVEYYRKRSTDIIWNLPINGTYGFSNLAFNTANLNGDGVDVGLNVGIINSKTVNWTSTINASYNTNVIRDSRFEGPTTSFGSDYLYSGYPSDYLFSFAWAGLDKTGQSLIKDPKNAEKTYTVNEYPFQDIRVYSGRSTSPWLGMWSNTVRYKGLELNVQLYGVFGGVFRKPSIENIGFTNNLFVGRTGDMEYRWRQPGDEAKTNIPGLEFGAGTNYNLSIERYRNSDLLIRSRSNIRLQQISLSYEVPQHLIRKVYSKSLTVSIIARNLGMLWAANKEKLDPEYLYTTGQNYQLPPLAAYSFRLSLNL
ncbi:SusC/RagA family TonB-linked outer membrane protein [Filimonas effusa]|nr:SusC/RagA family TonB-linked outer membrane protein [Filimonas effusa]